MAGGTFGYLDGAPTGAAEFYSPHGITVDSADNLYVADFSNNTVRKITPEGTNWVVTTLAGSPGCSSCSADGTGTNSQFSYPQGVAVDPVGNVFVTDSLNNSIRSITSGGVVSTLAGTAHTSGSTDGTGSSALFFYPQDLVVDKTGNVYVGDRQNYTIRKVTAAGVVSTVAGLAGFFGTNDGTGSEARFGAPNGVAVDGSDNVYVADSVNLANGSSIRKITPAWSPPLRPASTYPLASWWTARAISFSGMNSTHEIYELSPNGTNWTFSYVTGSDLRTG